MYWKTEYTAGNVREAQKSFRFRCTMEDGKIKRSRKPKGKPTAEAVRKYNEKQAARRLARKINANFAMGDYYVTLEYSGPAPDEETAEKLLKLFREALKRRYRKIGREFKWIACTEIGKRKLHHHLLIPRYKAETFGDFTKDLKEIQALWNEYAKRTSGGGSAYIKHINRLDNTDLAGYFTKKPRCGGKKKYSCSRNLVEPQKKERRIAAKTWKDAPVVPDGWMLVADSYEIGINPVTGYGYQYYRMVKLD